MAQITGVDFGRCVFVMCASVLQKRKRWMDTVDREKAKRLDR